jgi:hypothetical protein
VPRATPPVVAPGEHPFLTQVNHCVGNVELGKLDEWVDFYQRPGDAAHRAGHRRHRGQRPPDAGGARGVPVHPGSYYGSASRQQF